MIFKLGFRQVEVEVDQNSDGSLFICSGYCVDNGVVLTDDELNILQDLFDDSEQLNGLWTGE